MKLSIPCILVVACLLLSSPAHATLYGADGVAVPAGALRVLLFWREDCAPCRKELAALPALAKAHTALPIGLVILQSHSATLPVLPANVQLVSAHEAPEATLAAYGNRRKLLPFSAALHKDGTLCARHYGLLSDATLHLWEKQCAH